MSNISSGTSQSENSQGGLREHVSNLLNEIEETSQQGTVVSGGGNLLNLNQLTLTDQILLMRIKLE